MLIQVIHTRVASRLHYATMRWGMAAQTALNPIAVLQNRAICFILKALIILGLITLT